ncbi:MAG: FAD-dependent oxidoreductase [Bacteroidales bacterium]
MYKITQHPILTIPLDQQVKFTFNGQEINGQKGFTIAAALHQAGYPVHGHSLKGRKRSLECGIGKCGACEMLVDGEIRRICCTLVDNVKVVSEIPVNYMPTQNPVHSKLETKVYHTTVAIIGAGPAGLAVREELNKKGIPNLVIDANDKIGGQFVMQTHQFFFFEQEKKYGGMRGFDIANALAGDNLDGILLGCAVWDVLEGKKLGVKNKSTDEIFYVQCDRMVAATGALPFMPAFENDDLPGVYTAAVVQKMMNNEFTLLGKKILTVGAGNIGYLTSYQAMQAGAEVKAIIEAMPVEGGFPVQANRVRRLAIPIYLSHILLKAIPNKDHTGICGALIAECKDFKIIPGTEKIIEDIDVINICTGLLPDNQLFVKGREIFGDACYGVGDATRIGEGTSAVLRGKQCALEIMQALHVPSSYDAYLNISKQYIDSQQHPVRLREEAAIPDPKRRTEKGFVVLDCLYGFACNPCSFACKYGAITKSSTSTTPSIDYNKCIGCMECVNQCPGLAIFGYHLAKKQLFLPFEYEVAEGAMIFLVNNQGAILGEGQIEKILHKPNKTNVARVNVFNLEGEDLLNVRGFIVQEKYPKPLVLQTCTPSNKTHSAEDKTYICHCDDVEIDEIVEQIGGRKFISVDEIKHTTHLGMGPCRGKRCIPRLRQVLGAKGIELTGEVNPRAPLSNQILLGELAADDKKNIYIFPSKHKVIKVRAFIAGGGMTGSSLFRYMSEAGMYPLLANTGRGSSWRNLAGGRPAFGLPEISDLAKHNLELFKQLEKIRSIDFKPTRYVSFAHDEESYQALEASKAWSDAYMIDRQDFAKEISPQINPHLNCYEHALISKDCWQATPGKTIDLLREIGKEKGGVILENCRVVEVEKNETGYNVWVLTRFGEYVECKADYFINALGSGAEEFARKLDIETGLYPVKHQAFITRRLPLLGINNDSLDMLIDRRKYQGFSAVYGQQLKSTGQLIVCASPAVDAMQANANIKTNTQEFLEVVSQMVSTWIPSLKNVGFQASWAGYYTEPRYIVDPALGLFVGMRGHGFMLSQYIAKLYVDKLQGKEVPTYFDRMSLGGDGLSETAFK